MCIIFIVLLDYTHTILAPKLAALLLFVQVAIATTLNANIDFFITTVFFYHCNGNISLLLKLLPCAVAPHGAAAAPKQRARTRALVNAL